MDILDKGTDWNKDMIVCNCVIVVSLIWTSPKAFTNIKLARTYQMCVFGSFHSFSSTAEHPPVPVEIV